jgi:uncharacterized protein (TIGR03437 family)
VRKLRPDGSISLVAGAPNANRASDGDGGPAIAAHLLEPGAISVDPSGNLYIAEQSSKIRRVSPDGTITTIAGQNALGPSISGDGGPARNATFASIRGLLGAAQGMVYISDCAYPCYIRRIGQDGVINTIAGGPLTSSISDGPALSVGLGGADSFFLDSKGNLYFNEGGHIRRLTPQSMIETLSGGAPEAAPAAPDARQVWLMNPIAIAADRVGNLYIAEARCRIRKVSPTYEFTTVAGTDNCLITVQEGPRATTDLPVLNDLAVTSQGQIYAASAYGELLTISGESIARVPGVGKPQGDTSSYGPLRIALDSKDRLYALAISGSRIWRVAPGSQPGLFAAPPLNLYAIALDSADNVYVASSANAIGTVYTINAYGLVSGSRQLDWFGDSIVLDSAGRIFGGGYGLFGFSYSPLPSLFGFGGDGGPLVSAASNNPSRLILAASGDFYFIDKGNERIRRISGSPPSQAPSFPAAGVVNAASGAGLAIAPGELVSIYGTNLGPDSAWVNAPVNNVYPTVAGSTRVLFDLSPAPLLFATSGQINAWIPYSLGVSGSTSVSMQVEVDGVLSAPVTLTVAKSAPGLFTADGSGSGQGAILNQDTSDNGPSNPAARGSIVSLFGTGEGLVSPAPLDGALTLTAPYPAPAEKIAVSIGGQPAEVTYAGAAPFLPAGVIQINAKIPDGIAPGAAPVVVSAGATTTTRTVTVSVR